MPIRHIVINRMWIWRMPIRWIPFHRMLIRWMLIRWIPIRRMIIRWAHIRQISIQQMPIRRMPFRPIAIHRKWIWRMPIRWTPISRLPTRWMPISRMPIRWLSIRRIKNSKWPIFLMLYLIMNEQNNFASIIHPLLIISSNQFYSIFVQNTKYETETLVFSIHYLKKLMSRYDGSCANYMYLREPRQFLSYN